MRMSNEEYAAFVDSLSPRSPISPEATRFAPSSVIVHV